MLIIMSCVCLVSFTVMLRSSAAALTEKHEGKLKRNYSSCLMDLATDSPRSLSVYSSFLLIQPTHTAEANPSFCC